MIILGGFNLVSSGVRFIVDNLSYSILFCI